jgi:repressor LexA
MSNLHLGVYMAALSMRERQLIDYLEAFVKENAYPPSIRLIRQAMSYRSNSPVQVYLDRLEEKGYIAREKGKARTIRLLKSLTHPEDEFQGIFLQGTIAAGGVVESFTECAPEPVQVPDIYNKPGNYALKVIGDSMIGSHICSGDIVVLRPEPDVRSLKPGRIVAARVEGQGVTLKHFYLKGDRVTLQPANPDFEPITENASLVQVQGVLVYVSREY